MPRFVRSSRPAPTSPPKISVEFETADGRFRIDKTFLQAPASVLHERIGGEWKPLAEGDDADIRLTRLLQSKQPGKGATKAAAHWGLLGYLWMRQGELPRWPDWTENPAGQLVQSLLVKVEIDPFIEARARPDVVGLPGKFHQHRPAKNRRHIARSRRTRSTASKRPSPRVAEERRASSPTRRNTPV